MLIFRLKVVCWIDTLIGFQLKYDSFEADIGFISKLTKTKENNDEIHKRSNIKYRKAMFAGVHGAKEANDRVIELLKAEKYNQGE